MRAQRLSGLLLILFLALSLLLSACSGSHPQETLPVIQPVSPVQTDSGLPAQTEHTNETFLPVESTPAQTESIPPESESETEPAPAFTEPQVSEEPTDAPPEPSESSQQNIPGSLENDLTRAFSRSDWKKLNIFLSNFSEVYFSDFNFNNNWSEYNLLMFCFLHLKINDSSKIHTDGAFYTVTQSDMERCMLRFFDVVVTPQDYSKTEYGFTNYIYFENSTYYFPAADGEAYNCLTIARSMTRQMDGSYFVLFDIYELDLEEYFDRGISDSYYSLTSSEAAATVGLTQVGSGMAEIRDYRNGTFESYQLVSYMLD